MDCKSNKSVRVNKPVSFLIFFAIFTAILISLGSQASHAEITRGCEGNFILEIVNRSGDTLKNLDQFEGRGACKNTAHANTCRKRAMDNIFRCANDIWTYRWNLIGDPKDNNTDMILPAICRGDKTGARKVGFKTNPHGKGTDIKHAMEYYACCKMQPGAGTLILKLDVVSTGDKGCGKNYNKLGRFYHERRTLIDDYKASCPAVIKSGICAVRTGG